MKAIIWQNYQMRCSIFKRKLKVELPLNKFFKDSTINLKMAMNLQISQNVFHVRSILLSAIPLMRMIFLLHLLFADFELFR